MAAPRRVIEFVVDPGDLARLEALWRSRTEPASGVERARILLAYRAEPSSTAVGARIGVTHQTVQRCLCRAARLGVMAALDDSPRPGKVPDITPEAKAWLVSMACQKAWDTHTNCGPRGCWPVTPASTRPRPDIPPWPASSRARSARYS